MKFLMSSGIQKNSIAFSGSWCLTGPYAFSRSNQIATYIGRTCQRLEVRVKLHVPRDIRNQIKKKN